MSTQPPAGSPQISSYLVYDDPVAAIEWLEKAFGFSTRVRIEDGDGNIVHCELGYGTGVVGIGGPTPEARSPKAIGGHYTQSLYMFVDDIDAHYARAKSAGAKITRELENMDYGDRVYGCEDPEGHLWFFGYRYDDEAWKQSTQEPEGGG